MRVEIQERAFILFHRLMPVPLISVFVLETSMNNTEHAHPVGESHHGHIPYWKRAHHNWRFWFGLIAMLVAIGIYVGTNDLSMVPSGRQKQMPAGSKVP